MSKKKKIIIGDNWKRESDGKKMEGGQGTVYRVTYKGLDDKINKGIFYIFKELKQQKDKDRRRRMYREVSALKSLNHDKIPKVIETNVEKFEDIRENMFFISEDMGEETLRDVIKEYLKYSFEEIIDAFIKLIEVVEYCHKEGIIHRDIKPDNIVCKNGLENMYVIDFGLSFNKEENNDDMLTEETQQLGNRFLSLPELIGLNNKDKRDYRSDITLCCGILFFMLTNKNPITLINQKSEKPHQREEYKRSVLKINDKKQFYLRRFFDRAFEININDRWQSFESLKESIINIRNLEENMDGDIDEKMKELQKIMEKSQDKNKIAIKQQLEELNDFILSIRSELSKDFNVNYREMTGGFISDFGNYKLENQIGFINKLYETKICFPKFVFSFSGCEIVIAIVENQKEKQIYRINGFASIEDKEKIKQNVKKYYIDAIEKLELEN